MNLKEFVNDVNKLSEYRTEREENGKTKKSTIQNLYFKTKYGLRLWECEDIDVIEKILSRWDLEE